MSHALAAEWTKLRSTRSTYWLLLVGAAVAVGLAVLITVALGTGKAEVTGGTFDPVGISLFGVWFGQISFAVVGVLTMTSEYATGSIRTTLAAVPRRGMLLAAKLAAVGLVVLGIGTAISLAAFLAGQAVLAGQHRAVGLGDPGSARAVLSAGSYLAAMGLLGVALGALLRNTVGAVLTVLGLGLGPSLLGGLFPAWVRDHVLHDLPGPIGNRITAPVPGPAVVDYVALGAWVAVLALLAFVVIHRRDA
jgi:ABC-2 type transport system permease protein